MHGGRWAGHSVHTALSDLPIGFWSGALVLDLLGKDVPAGDGRMDPAATLSAAGLAAAVGTVATGVTDWTVSDGEDRRVGLFHGLLNTAGVALQARVAGRAADRTPPAGPGARRRPAWPSRPPPASSAGTWCRAGRSWSTGWPRPPGPSRWVRTVADAELPDGGHDRGRGRGPEGAAAPGAGGEMYALDDMCSHAGALLSRGQVDGCVVTCPLHESRFDLRDGRIVRGPAHQRQPVLPARARNGWIEVRGSQPRPRTARSRGEAPWRGKR